MSEEKQTKPGTVEKAKTPASHKKRETKTSRWTIENCQKAAKRFATIESWSEGAPSSFKAASAHNWVKQCSGHMTSAKGRKGNVA